MGHAWVTEDVFLLHVKNNYADPAALDIRRFEEVLNKLKVVSPIVSLRNLFVAMVRPVFTGSIPKLFAVNPQTQKCYTKILSRIASSSRRYFS